MSRKSAVVAIGGNSLIKDKQHQTVRDQYIAAGETCWHIASMIKDGWDVAIGHGNGPQVGFILRRSELASHELHEVPLDVCGADSQGAIGYALVQNLENDFRRLELDRHAVAVVTQVEVAADDPAFAASVEADRLVHGRADGDAETRPGRLGRARGRRARVASGRAFPGAAPHRRGRRDPLAHRERLRRDLRRRRRHSRRRRRERRSDRHRRRDRQGPRLLAARDVHRRRAASWSRPPSRRSPSTSARRTSAGSTG